MSSNQGHFDPDLPPNLAPEASKKALGFKGGSGPENGPEPILRWLVTKSCLYIGWHPRHFSFAGYGAFGKL